MSDFPVVATFAASSMFNSTFVIICERVGATYRLHSHHQFVPVQTRTNLLVRSERRSRTVARAFELVFTPRDLLIALMSKAMAAQTIGLPIYDEDDNEDTYRTYRLPFPGCPGGRIPFACPVNERNPGQWASNCPLVWIPTKDICYAPPHLRNRGAREW